MTDDNTAAEIAAVLASWAKAEGAGDADGLAAVLDPDFRAVGPRGFVLGTTEWTGRYRAGMLRNDSFDWEGADIRRYGDDTAVGIGQYSSTGAFQGQALEGTFKVTHVLHRGADGWKIVALHLSPVAGPLFQ
jgi:ketosteroid isomerase-like protein